MIIWYYWFYYLLGLVVEYSVFLFSIYSVVWIGSTGRTCINLALLIQLSDPPPLFPIRVRISEKVFSYLISLTIYWHGIFFHFQNSNQNLGNGKAFISIHIILLSLKLMMVLQSAYQGHKIVVPNHSSGDRNCSPRVFVSAPHPQKSNFNEHPRMNNST